MRDPAHQTTTEMRDDAAVASQMVSFRVDSAVLAAWKRAAAAAGISLTDFIVRRVNGAEIRIEVPPAPVLTPPSIARDRAKREHRDATKAAFPEVFGKPRKK